MRRMFFLLALGLFSWSALEMHEWVRVPEVLAHMLEHHSDLGHQDHANGHCANEPLATHDHTHDHDHDHSPFAGGCHGDACAVGMVTLPMYYAVSIIIPAAGSQVIGSDIEARLASFSGSKWNPPKFS